MRGAGRAGGRSFRPPRSSQVDRRNDVRSVVIDDLPVSPILDPIGNGFTISNFDEPVDARDCAKYPASPYCDGNTISIEPIGYEFEIRSNECETCLYIYPVILFLKLQPLIICRRDPNCGKKQPPPINRDPIISNKPERYNENVQPDPYKSEDCARRESIINAWHNWNNDLTESFINEETTQLRSLYPQAQIWIEAGEKIVSGGYPDPCIYLLASPYSIHGSEQVFLTAEDIKTVQNIYLYWKYTYNGTEYTQYLIREYRSWKVSRCCGMGEPPPIPKIQPPPPPPPEDRKDPPPNRRRRKPPEMCCNSCNDSADNTAKLLKELKEIKKILGTGQLQKALDAAVGIGDGSITAIVSSLHRRLGVDSYPINVPSSLLEGYGNDSLKIQSNAEFLTWLTYQVDGLVGQFPVEIEIKDIDPLTEGDQTKSVTLPNISEAIAEIYGLTIKNSVNQEVELNMLLRMAAEIIATKNAAVVTQDYSRANANFLGYKANYKPRELTYNFDFSGANLDPKAKEPIVLEKLLKTVTGYVQGWQLEDKETVVGFLQKLMFSAGIIKAVFFRGKGQQKELKREMESMAKDEKAQEQKFEAFINEINDPNSRFNKDSQDKPQMKDETLPEIKSKG